MQTSSTGIINSLCERLFKFQPKLLQATTGFLNSKKWSLLVLITRMTPRRRLQQVKHQRVVSFKIIRNGKNKKAIICLISVFISDIDTAKLCFQLQLTPKEPKLTVYVTLQDYWSTNTSAPPKDALKNFELVEAMEMGGYTSVKYERNLTTGESNIDVQFTVKKT